MDTLTNEIINENLPYFIASNQIVQDQRLSLKARGLACYMRSMPTGWKFSYRGLMNTTGEGQTTILSALKELIEAGYLERIDGRDEHGHKTCKYILHMTPCVDFPCVENPSVENPSVENPRTYKINNNKVNKNKINNNISPKKHFAEKVMLTEEEHIKLVNQFGEQGTRIWIERLDDYKASTGKKYASDYRTILVWSKKNNQQNAQHAIVSNAPKVNIQNTIVETPQSTFFEEFLEKGS